MVNLICQTRFSDLCYGYNAFWAAVVPQLQLDADGFDIEAQMNARAIRAKLRVAEVPSYESRRYQGSSHLHALRDGWLVLRTIVKEPHSEHESPV